MSVLSTRAANQRIVSEDGREFTRAVEQIVPSGLGYNRGRVSIGGFYWRVKRPYYSRSRDPWKILRPSHPAPVYTTDTRPTCMFNQLIVGLPVTVDRPSGQTTAMVDGITWLVKNAKTDEYVLRGFAQIRGYGRFDWVIVCSARDNGVAVCHTEPWEAMGPVTLGSLID